ncbi:MAG TPA: DUF5680 domain-containing protein [Anaerolineae bacterium]|nr:DUF5680 domain-containing protein [Anaerolineae bacterium]HQH39876.1 DUF5680 domain-containing protein [Anaerolineae bacterium]
MTRPNLPLNRELFVAFLLAAKQHTYAAQGGADAAVTPLLPGSRQLEYRAGRLAYRDVYFGSDYFAGQETVYYDTSPVWSMVYAGGRLKNMLCSIRLAVEMPQVYAFLQAALRHAPAEHPYRGPALWEEGDLVYSNAIHGDLERFWGIEIISYQDVAVYQLHYSGGVLH